MQLGLAITELLQRADRRDHIVAVRAGLSMALTHMMQLPLERQPPGVLRMAAVDHVAERRDSPFGIVLEPDRPNALAVDRGHLLAGTQIGDGDRALARRHAIGDAAEGSDVIE